MRALNLKIARINGASTVLVYMAGRNNLTADLDQDLEEIKRGSTRIGDNNLIVFVPQDAKKGRYGKMNNDIRQLSWYNAVGLNTLEQ